MAAVQEERGRSRCRGRSAPRCCDGSPRSSSSDGDAGRAGGAGDRGSGARTNRTPVALRTRHPRRREEVRRVQSPSVYVSPKATSPPQTAREKKSARRGCRPRPGGPPAVARRRARRRDSAPAGARPAGRRARGRRAARQSAQGRSSGPPEAFPPDGCGSRPAPRESSPALVGRICDAAGPAGLPPLGVRRKTESRMLTIEMTSAPRKADQNPATWNPRPSLARERARQPEDEGVDHEREEAEREDEHRDRRAGGATAARARSGRPKNEGHEQELRSTRPGSPLRERSRPPPRGPDGVTRSANDEAHVDSSWPQRGQSHPKAPAVRRP